MTEFKNIVVPTDFSESSKRALDVAVYLSQKHDAALSLVHVYEIPTYVYDGMFSAPLDFVTPIREAAEKQLEAALAELRKRVPNAKSILSFGTPWQEILRAVEQVHGDLIVMGTHGHRGLSRALLGSVAEKTVRMSPVPVLTVRADSEG